MIIVLAVGMGGIFVVTGMYMLWIYFLKSLLAVTEGYDFACRFCYCVSHIIQESEQVLNVDTLVIGIVLKAVPCTLRTIRQCAVRYCQWVFDDGSDMYVVDLGSIDSASIRMQVPAGMRVSVSNV
jgi:hypothetical protein